MKKNKVIILISVISIIIFSILIYLIIPYLRPIPDVKSVSIYFNPRGYMSHMNRKILIYNNDDKDYSDYIVKKITRARTELIDLGLKSTRCREGTYTIILDTDTGKLEYSVGNFGVIWDCQKIMVGFQRKDFSTI